jgi:hypothetical protein
LKLINVDNKLPISFSAREVLSKNKKFYITDKRLNNEKDCHDYSLNELQQFLWEITIDLAVQIIITDDGNITLIKAEEFYDSALQKFTYKPFSLSSSSSFSSGTSRTEEKSDDKISLLEFNPHARVIYNQIIIYDHLFPEILILLFHDELQTLSNLHNFKDPSQKREFYPIAKNNRRYNIIPDLVNNQEYDNISKLFNSKNISKLINDSLEILRDYILSGVIDQENSNVARFDTVWALFKDSLCDLLYLLFKLRKVSKTI